MMHCNRAIGAVLGLLVMFAIASLVGGCDGPNPHANTPTSGRLVVFVDEIYAPLITTLADTFMHRSPNAVVEVRPMPARQAVQKLFDEFARDTSHSDTGVTYAMVIGRAMLPDEKDAVVKGAIDSKEYRLAYDGLAVVVPNASPLKNGMLEGLRQALAAAAPVESMIDSTAPATPVRFLLLDQNSSTYAFVRATLRGDSDVVGPARYFSTTDSLLAGVAASEGVGLMGWYRAHQDSARSRTLAMGFVDTVGQRHPSAIVHVTSLVTDAYPIKLPIVGYTFASGRSLSVGFLAWLAKSQDAQYYFANAGLQPENVKIRLVIPER